VTGEGTVTSMIIFASDEGLYLFSKSTREMDSRVNVIHFISDLKWIMADFSSDGHRTMPVTIFIF